MSYRIAVVVPAYSPMLKPEEVASFDRTVSVLSPNHDICLITFEGLDLSEYHNIAGKYSCSLKICNFDKEYFEDIYTYSRLLMSKCFYQTFSEYEYMLVCQLDVWIFRDELQLWASKGYDYVGAPWLKPDVNKNCFLCELDSVGNGGLSFRKIEYFTKIYESKKFLFDFKQLVAQCKGQWYKYLAIPIRLLGYHNNFKWLLSLCSGIPEDMFWCITVNNTNLKMFMPPPSEAALFSFEVNPAYLYSLTGKLPMGCHAFKRWDYDSFWKQYIQIE